MGSGWSNWPPSPTRARYRRRWPLRWGARPARDPLTDTLTAALARQQLLIVLDNCEQVITAVAELCGTLPAGRGRVRVLATSREPVGLAGETRYRLRPAGDAGARPGVRRLRGNGLVQLTRARQADPRFRLDDVIRAAGRETGASLDGLPLALELAAARVESLGLPSCWTTG